MLCCKCVIQWPAVMYEAVDLINGRQFDAGTILKDHQSTFNKHSHRPTDLQQSVRPAFTQ